MKPTSVEKTRAIANISTCASSKTRKMLWFIEMGRWIETSAANETMPSSAHSLNTFSLSTLPTPPNDSSRCSTRSSITTVTITSPSSISPRSERSITSQASVFSANGEHVSLNRLPAPWPSPLPCEEAASDEDEDDPESSPGPPSPDPPARSRRHRGARPPRPRGGRRPREGGGRWTRRSSQRLHCDEQGRRLRARDPRELARPARRSRRESSTTWRSSLLVAAGRRESSPQRAFTETLAVLVGPEREHVPSRALDEIPPNTFLGAFLRQQRNLHAGRHRSPRRISGIPEATRPILGRCLSTVYAQGFRRV